MGYLEDVYISGMIPSEIRNRPSNENYLNLQNEISELKSKMLQELNQEQKVLFDELINLCYQSNLYELSNAFANGFKIGGKLILEIHQKE